MAVVFALNVARGARGNHDGFASYEQRVNHASLRVVGFVWQYRPRRGCIEQDVSAVQIVSLSGHQVKPRRVAQGIDRGVDLCGQSSPAAFDGLLLRTPSLLFAPELVGSNDGRIDHHVFVVGVLRHGREDAFPHPRLAPSRVAQVNHPEISEPLGHVAPWDAHPVPVQHRIDEQAVVSSRGPHMARASRQQILDALLLIISQ